MIKAAYTYASTPTTGLFLELELRQLLERLFGAAGKCDLLPVIVDIEAVVWDGDQVPAEAEEAADLQDGDEASLLGHDKIVDSADFLGLVVLHAPADELGDLVTLSNGHHVDRNELNGLRMGDTDRDDGTDSCSGQDTDSGLPAAQGRRGLFGGEHGGPRSD